MKSSYVILKPITTEKSTQKEGVYAFVVHSRATKIDIKSAFKNLYGVAAQDVKTINVVGKSRIGKKRNTIAKRARHKKAVITTLGRKKIDINKFSSESK